MTAAPVDLAHAPSHPHLGLWARRTVVALFTVVVAAALLDTFGQKPSTTTVRAPEATVTVRAPDTVRGGLFFETRLDVRARTRIAEPRIVLDPGVLVGMQVNSIEPAAASETSRDGRVELSYDAVEAGELLRIWMQFEVNPTNAGTRRYGIDVDDATRRIARVQRTLRGPALMDLVLRTVVVFLLILVVTRAVGRRELSSLEPFDLILLIVIGDLVQQGVTQSDQSLTGTVIVIATLSVLTVVTAYLSFRFRRLRPLLEGDPVVLIADGDLLERNLRSQRMTVDELRTEARLNQIGSLDEVDWAVLESNGRISFLTGNAGGPGEG